MTGEGVEEMELVDRGLIRIVDLRFVTRRRRRFEMMTGSRGLAGAGLAGSWLLREHPIP